MPKPTKPVRWTRQAAAAQFGCDAQTLSNRLVAASIAPGEDGLFATQQIVAAIHGDLDIQRTRNEAAKADLNEAKRDFEKRRLIPAGEARAAVARLTAAISKVMSASPLSAKQQATIAGNLERLNDLFAKETNK